MKTSRIGNRIRFNATLELAARTSRLALKKQGNAKATGVVAREALVQYVEREEKKLNLEQMTPEQVEAQLAGSAVG